MPSIYIKEKFLTQEKCDNVIEWLEKNPDSFYAKRKNDSGDYESLSLVYKETIVDGKIIYFDNEVVNSVIEYFWHVVNKKKSSYKSQFMVVTKSYPGTVLQAHYDFADDDNKEPGTNYVSTKNVKTFVCYLNDDYEGGELYIEDRFTYKPEAGSFILFDGNIYKHGVKIITENPRYAIVATFAEIN